MADEPKEVKEPGEENEIVRPPSDEEIYGADDPVRDDPSETPPDPVIDRDGDGDDEGDAEKGKEKAGGKKPEADPEPEKKPTGKSPKEGDGEGEGEQPGEGGEEEEPRPVVLWDPDRQRKDQDKANERKSLEARVAEQAAQIAELTTKAQAKAEKPGASQADKDAADDLEALQSEVQAMDPEDMDTGKIKTMLSKVTAALKSAKSTKTSSEVEELRQQIAEIKAEREQERTEQGKATERNQAAQLNAALNRYLLALDDEYSPKLRNEASVLVAEMIANPESGYSASKLPDLTAAKLMYKDAYRTLAEEKGIQRKSKGRTKGSDKDAPTRPARGAGGPVIPPGTKLKPGTVDEYLAQMHKQRKFKP